MPGAKKPPKCGMDSGESKLKNQGSKYQTKGPMGSKVICVVNFPAGQIANFISEVLVTRLLAKNKIVFLRSLDEVLCTPDTKMPNLAQVF